MLGGGTCRDQCFTADVAQGDYLKQTEGDDPAQMKRITLGAVADGAAAS